MDHDTITNEAQHFVGSKDLADVRAGSCQLKTCPKMRCLETRTGITECVKDKRKQTQVYTESNTALFDACMAGELARVKFILSHDRTNINSRGEYNMTPVMHTAKGGHREVFYLLVEEGANLASLDDENRNLLHFACIGGNVEMVQYLLTRNIVGINSRDNHRTTPVMNAALYGRKGVFDLLVKAKADLLLVNVHHETILHLACQGRNIEIIKYILTNTIVDIDSQDINGVTSVLDAASEGYTEVLDVLVEAGADLYLDGDDRQTTLHAACEWGNIGIIQYILTHKLVDINSRDGDDCTSAMIAAREGHKDAFFLLVENEADLTITNDAGDNILDMACEGGNVHIVKYVSKLHIGEGPFLEDDPC